MPALADDRADKSGCYGGQRVVSRGVDLGNSPLIIRVVELINFRAFFGGLRQYVALLTEPVISCFPDPLLADRCFPPQTANNPHLAGLLSAPKLQRIAGFAALSAHEATRTEPDAKLLELSLSGLSHSVS